MFLFYIKKKKDFIFQNFNMFNYAIYVRGSNQIERCLISVLYDYRYRGKKDYYKCKPHVVINAIKNYI